MKLVVINYYKICKELRLLHKMHNLIHAKHYTFWLILARTKQVIPYLMSFSLFELTTEGFVGNPSIE